MISWLSKLFLAMGLPSLGFSGPGRSVAAAAPAGPSWQKVAGKLGWTWFWDWEDGLGLSASSTLGSSFRWNGDLSVSLWLAAAVRTKRNRRNEKKLKKVSLRGRRGQKNKKQKTDQILDVAKQVRVFWGILKGVMLN